MIRLIRLNCKFKKLKILTNTQPLECIRQSVLQANHWKLQQQQVLTLLMTRCSYWVQCPYFLKTYNCPHFSYDTLWHYLALETNKYNKLQLVVSLTFPCPFVNIACSKAKKNGPFIKPHVANATLFCKYQSLWITTIDSHFSCGSVLRVSELVNYN